MSGGSHRRTNAHSLAALRLCFGLFLFVQIISLSIVHGAFAQDAGFYQGKTLRIVVGLTPGGGYDTYARLLGRHIGRHIPGQPFVVVQNMPGAGSLTSVRALDVTQAADGLTITAFNAGLITQSITSPNEVNVDLRNYAWLGSASEDIRVCFTWHTRNAKTWTDLLGQKELSFGATAPGTLGYVEARIVKDYLKVPLRLVPGYPGSAEKRLAVESGELDGDCGGWVNIPPDWIKEKKINVLVRFSRTLLPGMDASAPFAGDLLKDDAQRLVYALLVAPEEIGRPFIVSKAVPNDRLATLRKAFMGSLADPALVAEADRGGLTLSPVTGDEVMSRLNELYRAPPEVVAEARTIMGGT